MEGIPPSYSIRIKKIIPSARPAPARIKSAIPANIWTAMKTRGGQHRGKGLEQAVRHVSPRLYSLKLHACR
ncbi:hypothetical protein CXT84_02345 [Akkermansia muciniphila]|nr:hypothetical protein [Akkermansia muciniphila]OUN27885.1 hypothetical protein B5G29_06995 [Akkermansia muciniphila]PNC85691.1 hypothetical protein CXT93_01190 [Akkermansia muciniphila]PNC99627.1 hypothetical protein CXT87_06390 [Akkermansia muciniphila]PND03561.1 hypothetical protein CXT86_11440 [Akkermansia muciniphila]